MPGFQIPIEGVDAGAIKGPSHTDEMLRKYRWNLEIAVPGATPEQNSFVDLKVSSCDRPKVEIKEMEIHNGPDVIYRPGKVTYKPITIKYYEAVTSNNKWDATASRFYDWWASAVYYQLNSSYGTFLNAAASCVIKLKDGKGTTNWTYKLFNCWPSSIEPDGLDYGSNEILTYSVTLRYDKYIELMG